MEDVKIMKNMKEVLKKTRKLRHKKSRGTKSSDEVDPNDDAISEILNKNWMFSSPPDRPRIPQEEVNSPKLNAFQLMMSKKPEPLSQISPEVNGIKKKKKYTRKPKYNKLDSDIANNSANASIDENNEAKTARRKAADEPTTMLMYLKGMEPEVIEEFEINLDDATIEESNEVENGASETLIELKKSNSEADELLTRKRLRKAKLLTQVSEEEEEQDIMNTHNRKRLRTSETPTRTQNGSQKKIKTKPEKVLLDSNENSIETPMKELPEAQFDSPTSQGRPRRSCAGKVNYEMLISPDKILKSAETRNTTSKRSSKTRQPKAKDLIETLVIDEDSPVKKSNPVKLAPLFMRKLPKPSIDPTVKEARRNFLLSGLPEDLRNTIDKQKEYEDEILSNELIAFPSISHVTQLKSESIANEANPLWEKSFVKINADDVNDNELSIAKRFLKRGELTDCCDDDAVPVICDKIRSLERKSIKNVKEIAKQTKEQLKNFPTNRCFKKLYWKYQNATKDNSDSEYISDFECGSHDDNMLFVDIFKPTKFDEFLVNAKPVKDLHNFLLTWNDKSEECDTDESGSRQSSRALNNFAVLSGGNGGGKTSSVFALARDLNYQVIEINAGTRRSGKKMLQELFEATQSHRVKDKSGKMFSSQDGSENSQETNSQDPYGAQTVILIEDAEIVFDTDEGFVSSLQSLINCSKRPVLLTTNNRNCQHLQKFIQHNEIMFDSRQNANHIAQYLSLLCLAANYQINAVALEHLYALNGHDLRKTINEIEFFIRSGNSRSNDGDLMALFERPRRERLTRGELKYGNKSLSTLSFDTAIVSSFAAMSGERANGDETSYHHRHLMDEMAEFFVERCNVAETQCDSPHGKQKIIESSISGELISASNSALNTSRATATDYSPMLRDICRSEKARNETGRRTTNNRGHYLRFLITQNSFGNDYFNEQCEMFQQ